MVTRIEPWYANKQRIRGAHHQRLSDWLASTSGHSVCVGFGSYKRPVYYKGNKLIAWTPNGAVMGWFWRHWLVLSKRAPKWVRNWAKREVHQVVEMWAPLTERNVRESVEFAITCQQAAQVYHKLKGDEDYI